MRNRFLFKVVKRSEDAYTLRVRLTSVDPVVDEYKSVKVEFRKWTGAVFNARYPKNGFELGDIVELAPHRPHLDEETAPSEKQP